MLHRMVFLSLGVVTSVIFSDVLTLDGARKKALSDGWQIRINELDSKARDWQKRNVIAGYMPSVTYGASLIGLDSQTVANANFFYQSIPDSASKSEMMMRSNQLSHDITLSQPLFNGGAEIVAIQMANHTKMAQELGYDADRKDLILTVTRAYYDLLRAQEQHAIMEKDFEWAEKNLETATMKFNGGTMPRTDLLRWQGLVSEKKSNLLRSEALVTFTNAHLTSTMGMDPNTAPLWEVEPFSSFEERFNALDSVVHGTVDENPRLKSLEAYQKLAVDSRKMAVTTGLPKLNGYLQYSLDQGWDYNSDGMHSKDRSLAGGLNLSVPLFTGFRTSTVYLEKKYDAIKSQVNYEQTKSALTTNLIRTREFYNASRSVALSAREMFSINMENFMIMNQRYSAGQLSQLDLLEMDRAVVGSKIDYISKVLDALYYHAEYLNAMGKMEE